MLTIETWMQATLFVYTFRKASSPRQLRRLLSQNTRAGIGTTLFLESGAFPDENPLKPPPWLRVLHSLNRGRIFAFSGGPKDHRMDLLSLSPTNRSKYWALCWQKGIHLRRLAVSQITLESGALRGHWLGAELDSRNQGLDYQAVARERRTHPSSGEVILSESLRLLGLGAGANTKEIRQAFRRLARETHPDVSQLPTAEAEARFRRLQIAYQKALSERIR